MYMVGNGRDVRVVSSIDVPFMVSRGRTYMLDQPLSNGDTLTLSFSNALLGTTLQVLTEQEINTGDYHTAPLIWGVGPGGNILYIDGVYRSGLFVKNGNGRWVPLALGASPTAHPLVAEASIISPSTVITYTYTPVIPPNAPNEAMLWSIEGTNTVPGRTPTEEVSTVDVRTTTPYGVTEAEVRDDLFPITMYFGWPNFQLYTDDGSTPYTVKPIMAPSGHPGSDNALVYEAVSIA